MLTLLLGVSVVNYSALKTVFVPRFAPTFTDEVCASVKRCTGNLGLTPLQDREYWTSDKRMGVGHFKSLCEYDPGALKATVAVLAAYWTPESSPADTEPHVAEKALAELREELKPLEALLSPTQLFFASPDKPGFSVRFIGCLRPACWLMSDPPPAGLLGPRSSAHASLGVGGAG